MPSTPGFDDFQVLHDFEGTCDVRRAVYSMCKTGNQAHSGVPGANSEALIKMCGQSDSALVDKVFDQESPIATVSFEKSVPFVGWLLVNPKGGADSSNFAVYASNHTVSAAGAVPEREWTLVGTPAWSIAARMAPSKPENPNSQLYTLHPKPSTPN